MAPVGTVDVVEWFFHPTAGILSLVAFLIGSIVLIAICMGRKKPTNAYEVNETKGDEAGANGDTTTKTGATSDMEYSWKSHDHMPPSTLHRSREYIQ